MPVVLPDRIDPLRGSRSTHSPALLVVIVAACLVAAGCSSGASAGGGNDAVLVGIVDTGVGDGVLEHAVDRAGSRSVVPGEDLTDVDGHGTEMAWIVHRAAPDARLVVAKAVDRHGAATDERIAAAVGHLQDVGASVVLVTLAGAEPLPRTREAFADAADDDILVVVAAGNDGLDLGRSKSYPGGYRLPNLVTVAATDSAGRLLGSSNHGGPTTVTAPGAVPTCGLDGRPTIATGTSAASAAVAGMAAALGANGHRTTAERVERLHADRSRSEWLAPPPQECS